MLIKTKNVAVKKFKSKGRRNEEKKVGMKKRKKHNLCAYLCRSTK